MSELGKIVRTRRLEKEITLRKFAQRVGVSATYISRMERGDVPPPSEATIKAIANELDLDADELLAMAGKFSTDLREIIGDRPKEMADFLRSARGLSGEAINELAKKAKGMKSR